MRLALELTVARYTMQRLDTLRFALAGGIYAAVCVAMVTICTLLDYGYSVSSMGIAVGAFWGFIEGFVHLGIFAWLYNTLLGTKPI